MNSFLWVSVDILTRKLSWMLLLLLFNDNITPGQFSVVGYYLITLSIVNLFFENGINQYFIYENGKNQNLNFETIREFSKTIVLIFVLIAIPLSCYAFLTGLDIETLLFIAYAVIFASTQIYVTFNVAYLRFERNSKISIMSVGSTFLICYAWNLVSKNAYSGLLIFPVLQTAIQYLMYRYNHDMYNNGKEYPKKIDIKSYLKFTIPLLTTGLIDLIYRNIFFIVIFLRVSPETAGLYLMADRIKDIVISQLSQIYSTLAFPIFSLAKNRRFFDLTIQVAVVFTLAICIIFIFFVEAFRALLNEKWHTAIDISKSLTWAFAPIPISSLLIAFLKSNGRTKELMYLEIFKKILFFCVIFLWSPGDISSLITFGAWANLSFLCINLIVVYWRVGLDMATIVVIAIASAMYTNLTFEFLGKLFEYILLTLLILIILIEQFRSSRK